MRATSETTRAVMETPVGCVSKIQLPGQDEFLTVCSVHDCRRLLNDQTRANLTGVSGV